MTTQGYWAVAQTVSKMEHIVRREIEKTNHGAFVPTYAKQWKVDDREYSKEYPLLLGYVFFRTRPDDWAGIPDIHGVYGVLATPDRVPAGPLSSWENRPCRVSDAEMKRLMIGHAAGEHNMEGEPRYTRYYRPSAKPVSRHRQKRRRPRPGKRIRNLTRT